MRMLGQFRRWLLVSIGACSLLLGSLALIGSREANAAPPWLSWRHRPTGDCACDGGEPVLPGEMGGTWYWMRSPDEEKRVVAGLYNRYCVRCHGVDGRGVWDIPDVPDFTNVHWQASRTDAQIARITLEGRGAVMPPFRGAMTLEESWAMARYLRTFVPGTETPRPDLGKPDKPGPKPDGTEPKKPEGPVK